MDQLKWQQRKREKALDEEDEEDACLLPRS